MQDKTAPAHLPLPVAKRWLTLGILTALYAVSLLDRQIFALLVEPIRKTLQISDFQVAALQGLVLQ